MKKVLEIIEKAFKDYGWMTVVFYILGYILIRIQYAQYGIVDVQIFKERYILAGLVFLFFCLPAFLTEYILEITRAPKTSKILWLKWFIILIMPPIMSLILSVVAKFSIYYNKVSEFNGMLIYALGVILVLVVKIFEIIERRYRKKEKLIYWLLIIVLIFIIFYMSLSNYLSYSDKLIWCNIYFKPFIILESILIIRIIMEKFYIKEIKMGDVEDEKIKEQKENIKFVRVLLVPVIFFCYSNFIFDSLPAEIGGGSISKIRIETEEEKLLEEISNRNIYLLDRSNDAYILIIEENKEDNIYKTIEISKDKVILIMDN